MLKDGANCDENSMREMVTFFGEELSKNEELLSSERKASRSILNLFVEGAFSYLAIDHAEIDEDEFALRCMSDFRVKVGSEWDEIVAKVAKSRKAVEVIEDEEDEEGEPSEGDLSPPKMADSDEGEEE
jgi:hypothetical protein